MKKRTTTFTVALVGLALLLGAAGSADAQRGGGGQRDVIADAEVICDFPLVEPFATLPDPASDQQILDFACVILWKTDSANGFVAYLLRNAPRNETAQLRKMSSVVLSMDDVIERGKENQRETAAAYACAYADKAEALFAAGKLEYLLGDDLAADAENIVHRLGFECL